VRPLTPALSRQAGEGGVTPCTNPEDVDATPLPESGEGTGVRARGKRDGRWTVIVALAVACGGGSASSPSTGTVGASIAVLQSGALVAVVNPDQGSVSFLDPDTLVTKATVSVGGEPHALLELADGSVLVANYRGGEVLRVDPTAATVSFRKTICAGPYGLAASADGSWIAVSCEWDGTVQKLDGATLAGTTFATGLRRPRALAVQGDGVVVADYVGGLVHTVGPGGTDSVASLVPTAAPYRPALTQMSANLASAVVPAFGAIQVAHVLENHTGDTSEPVADDYGTVTNTNPKLNPAVTTLGLPPGSGATPVLYAQYDGGSRVYSGPVAAAAFGSHYLLVAHVSTANVAVVDLSATSPGARAVGTFSVGFGPSGIAVDATRNVAFVDNALDGSVSRIDLAKTFAPGAPLFPAGATLVRALPSPYSTAALAGRQLFFDATNTHVTPSGVVACASCHPSGTDDGLIWFEHTPNIPYRHRRTPHLANAKTPTAPFHWDGQFRTMSELVESTMKNLMGGDGLLVDVTTVQAFIDEVVKAPVLPVSNAASVARGEAIFDSPEVGCSVCHSGSIFTDDKMHPVLDPMSLDPKDGIHTANTPGLHGVFLTAPYFHDGRSPSLEDLLTRPDAAAMGHHLQLTVAQRDDLIAYLESL
jgi:DNA-binding beta-propeller fold protein YncE/mono/diheme cytochrome c family protein